VSFIFKDILCHWGAVAELVTDNEPTYIQALELLANWYGIRHIWISPYNSQANSMVQWHHFDVQEAIIKSTQGGETHWSSSAHLVFWAEWVTILKSPRLLPYFMVHSIEPLFPFNLAEATFLVPTPKTDPTFRSDLISWRAWQLQKHVKDIDNIWERVLLSWFASIKQFKVQFKNQIQDHDFQPGSLVLVQNTQVEKELN